MESRSRLDAHAALIAVQKQQPNPIPGRTPEKRVLLATVTKKISSNCISHRYRQGCNSAEANRREIIFLSSTKKNDSPLLFMVWLLFCFQRLNEI